MIHILPRIEYSIDSTKSPEDISTILKSATVPRDMMYCDSGNAEFTGEVNFSDFKIIEGGVIKFHNSFEPVIVGNIRTESGMSVIDIKIRLSLPVQIFLTIWFGGVGIGFLGGLIAVFTKGMDGMSMLFVSVVMFALAQVAVRIGFYFPAKYTMKKLEELLK